MMVEKARNIYQPSKQQQSSVLLTGVMAITNILRLGLSPKAAASYAS